MPYAVRLYNGKQVNKVKFKPFDGYLLIFEQRPFSSYTMELLYIGLYGKRRAYFRSNKVHIFYFIYMFSKSVVLKGRYIEISNN